jgi:uncharacterized protein YndB with AHSA1/START domain
MENQNTNSTAGKEPVVVKRTYDAPIEKVWAALTDVSQMRQWYFDLADFKPEPGFEFQFLAGTDDKKWLHLCKVTDVVPGRKLTYSWRYDGYEGNSYVTFELSPENGGTKLTLTHTGLETFPAIPEFAKGNFMEGWTHFAGKALPEFLAKASAA